MIHFGRFDGTVISGNAIDISFVVSITSSTDPVETAITPLWVLATASLVVCPIDLVRLIRRLWTSAGSGNCWSSLKKGCPYGQCRHVSVDLCPPSPYYNSSAEKV